MGFLIVFNKVEMTLVQNGLLRYDHFGEFLEFFLG